MICVDASVAAKWIFEEPWSSEAEALYHDAITTGERIVSPPLLPIEVTNIVRQRMRRANPPGAPLLSPPEARQHLERFLTFSVELSLSPGVHEQALELAVAYDLPAVYDAHYLALAQLLGCTLWTADRTLVNALRDKLPFVRWLGDYTRP